MDGRLNCGLAAQSAAHTKIRHLENQVRETIEQVDRLGDQVLEINNALDDHITQVSEQLDTNKVIADIVDADTVEATNVMSDNVNTLDLTATTIEAETISADNLENVNVLHGQTVDVNKTIATIGQFTETQTTTANNGTTNTTELNVDDETNLTGQVNIDGNMTFTKDTGLSKLQGNYLEIDANNIVIDMKDEVGYALYVPGIHGDALFGGSVAVQDTLAAKNLIVTGETYIGNLTLNEDTVLENPTFENITETEELTDKALDIDENGKLVRKFIAGGSAGTVANALISNDTEYTYDLLDKYKQVDDNNPIYHIILSDTANYTFNTSGTSNAYLENNNGLRYEFENSSGTLSLILTLTSLVHNNIFYAVVPTLDADVENVISARLIKINLNNMNLEYSIDVSEYFAVAWDEFPTYLCWIGGQSGNVLSEDKPVLPIVDTNKYFDLVSGNIQTSDQNFFIGNTYYLSKTNTWYVLTGNFVSNAIWATNNKYTSIEDAALINEPYLENDKYVIDTPVFSIGDDDVKWMNNGVLNTLAIDGKDVLIRDENNNKVFITPGKLMFNDVEYDTNLYNNIGYVVNEYVAATPYQIEKVKIDRTQANFNVPVVAENITVNDIATIEDIETSTIDAEVVKTIDAEIDGMFFYEGEWYHKRMSTKTELLDFVKNNTEDKNFKILFDGTYIHFTDSDFPELIPNSTIVGTYQVYNNYETVNISYTLQFRGETTLLYNAFQFFDKIQFYKFNTSVNFKNLLNMNALHLNDCLLKLENVENASEDEFTATIGCDNMNNVEVSTEYLGTILTIVLNHCTNVKVANFSIPSGANVSFEVTSNDSDRCYVAAGSDNITYKQYYGGYNLILNTNTWTQIQPTYN